MRAPDGDGAEGQAGDGAEGRHPDRPGQQRRRHGQRTEGDRDHQDAPMDGAADGDSVVLSCRQADEYEAEDDHGHTDLVAAPERHVQEDGTQRRR